MDLSHSSWPGSLGGLGPLIRPGLRPVHLPRGGRRPPGGGMPLPFAAVEEQGQHAGAYVGAGEGLVGDDEDVLGGGCIRPL